VCQLLLFQEDLSRPLRYIHPPLSLLINLSSFLLVELKALKA
jgi:hypothetical protein